jgi:hypothetical protein
VGGGPGSKDSSDGWCCEPEPDDLSSFDCVVAQFSCSEGIEAPLPVLLAMLIARNSR